MLQAGGICYWSVLWCFLALKLEKKVGELEQNGTQPLNTEDSGGRSSHHVIRVPSALKVSVELICGHLWAKAVVAVV